MEWTRQLDFLSTWLGNDREKTVEKLTWDDQIHRQINDLADYWFPLQKSGDSSSESLTFNVFSKQVDRKSLETEKRPNNTLPFACCVEKYQFGYFPLSLQTQILLVGLWLWLWRERWLICGQLCS